MNCSLNFCSALHTLVLLVLGIVLVVVDLLDVLVVLGVVLAVVDPLGILGTAVSRLIQVFFMPLS